jgi:hypothetical protein
MTPQEIRESTPNINASIRLTGELAAQVCELRMSIENLIKQNQQMLFELLSNQNPPLKHEPAEVTKKTERTPLKTA